MVSAKIATLRNWGKEIPILPAHHEPAPHYSFILSVEASKAKERADRGARTLQQDPQFTSWSPEEVNARHAALIAKYEEEDKQAT